MLGSLNSDSSQPLPSNRGRNQEASDDERAVQRATTGFLAPPVLGLQLAKATQHYNQTATGDVNRAIGAKRIQTFRSAQPANPTQAAQNTFGFYTPWDKHAAKSLSTHPKVTPQKTIPQADQRVRRQKALCCRSTWDLDPSPVSATMIWWPTGHPAFPFPPGRCNTFADSCLLILGVGILVAMQW